jgi:arsenite methyltransferase
MSSTDTSEQADYGQDAPGVRKGMFTIAAIGLVTSLVAWLASFYRAGIPIRIAFAIEATGSLIALYGAGMGIYMTWGSRIGKLRTRDNLLEMAQSVRPWKGDEVVLDVGCGRGLMLIGAAKLLDQGIAIGIDLWREQDQSNNSLEAVIENARRENVLKQIQIITGDARNIPFKADSFDIVLSHWVLHNLDSEKDQKKALEEMWRVLRPEGILVLADIRHVEDYLNFLNTLGAAHCLMLDGGWEAKIMEILSGGTYRPQALICSSPGLDVSK